MKTDHSHRTRVVLTLVGVYALCSAAVALAQPAEPGPPPVPGPPAGEAFALRAPAISPDGSMLCVGYRGDLWLVPGAGGRAHRLTDHVAYDTSPAWSPDGRWVAFSSSRDGNHDVFLAPADGGPAEQLTFHSVDDMVTGFTPDSREVLFVSRRAGRWSDLWAVPIEGGMPRRLTADRIVDGVLSPDGSLIAATRGGTRWWRRGYRGSADGELWLVPVDGSPARRLTDNDVIDLWPLWDAEGRAVYFVSERSGAKNLWRQPLDRTAGAAAGPPEQITRLEGGGVEFPAISADGRSIVFVHEGLLYTVPADGSTPPARVPVVARSDDKVSRRERLAVEDGATDLVLSADGKQVAFVVHGEIFTRPTPEDEEADEDDDEARRRTESPGRDQQPAFVSGEDALVFLSDRDGQQDVWRADLTQEGVLSPTRLTRTADEEDELQVSPDGKWILFMAGVGNLRVMPVAGGEPRALVSDEEIYSPVFSPDSRWIAYERHDASGMGDVWVVPVAGGEPINLTKDPAHDQRPFWSPDGMALGYESDRDDDWDLWTLALVDEDERRDREREKRKRDKKRGKSKRGDDDDDEDDEEDGPPEIEPIEIDPDKDYEPHHLLDLAGTQELAVYSPDSERIVFLSNTFDQWDVWVADADGDDPEQLTDNRARESDLVWFPGGEMFAYLSRGRIYTMDDDGGDREQIAFALRMRVDHVAERRQVFNQAWRQLRAQFYDEALHDKDWEAARQRLLPYVDHVATQEELHLVVYRLLGELNASHLGIWNPEEPEGAARTGHLGLALETDERGLRVVDVLPDGPCDQDGARVEVGEYLTAVGGAPVGVGDNIYPLLDGKVDKKLKLTLADRPGGDPREVEVEPISREDYADKVYERWEDERKAIVAERTQDRLGYIHLRAMNRENLRKFRRSIIGEVYDKAGLIIDVRDNGGGNIHEQLLDILEGKPYAVSDPRAGYRRVQPAMGWHRPMVVLINQSSGSDAEIFPHGFRTLRLGKLIGVPTAGAVIGTGGTTLMDGSWLRLPRVGWYSLEGRNLENWGIEPDVFVEQDPADRAHGVDTQLERAIRILLEEVERTPARATPGQATAGSESPGHE